MGYATIYDKFNQSPIELNGAKTLDKMLKNNPSKADSIDPIHKSLDSQIGDSNCLDCVIFMQYNKECRKWFVSIFMHCVLLVF